MNILPWTNLQQRFPAIDRWEPLFDRDAMRLHCSVCQRVFEVSNTALIHDPMIVLEQHRHFPVMDPEDQKLLEALLDSLV